MTAWRDREDRWRRLWCWLFWHSGAWLTHLVREPSPICSRCLAVHGDFPADRPVPPMPAEAYARFRTNAFSAAIDAATARDLDASGVVLGNSDPALQKAQAEFVRIAREAVNTKQVIRHERGRSWVETRRCDDD